MCVRELLRQNAQRRYASNRVYMERMRLAHEPFLLEADARGKQEGRKAYCHVVSCRCSRARRSTKALFALVFGTLFASCNEFACVVCTCTMPGDSVI